MKLQHKIDLIRGYDENFEIRKNTKRRVKNKKPIDYKVGTVLTKLNDRTLSVVVYEKYKEKKYFKIRYKEKRILVHDYHNECSRADVVLIRRCKRVGRWKNYMVSTNLSLFWAR